MQRYAYHAHEVDCRRRCVGARCHECGAVRHRGKGYGVRRYRSVRRLNGDAMGLPLLGGGVGFGHVRRAGGGPAQMAEGGIDPRPRQWWSAMVLRKVRALGMHRREVRAGLESKS